MRDEYIYYVLYDAKRIKACALYRNDQRPPQTRLGAQEHVREGFTDDYSCARLVYWESFDDVANAIDRGKQLQRWRREKKEWLIERKNADWKDLAADWYETETPCR
jgi:putative endonuclease